MNFLELVQTFCRETGISQSGPSSVQSQTGDLRDAIDWIAAAYVDIQNRHGGRWRWLKREFQLLTQASVGTYAFAACTDLELATPIDRFNRWYLNDLDDPPRIFRTADGVGGETFMSWLEFPYFRGIHRIGTQNPTRSLHISVDPADRIVLGPTPNDQFTVTGWYCRGPQMLMQNEDVPEMPAHFHRLIVYYAMEHYGFKLVSQENFERSRLQGRRVLRQLEANQLPPIRLAGPL